MPSMSFIEVLQKNYYESNVGVYFYITSTVTLADGTIDISWTTRDKNDLIWSVISHVVGGPLDNFFDDVEFVPPYLITGPEYEAVEVEPTLPRLVWHNFGRSVALVLQEPNDIRLPTDRVYEYAK
jgi:hypothetical protein